MHTLVNYFKACTHNHHSGQEIQLYQLPQKYLHIPCPNRIPFCPSKSKCHLDFYSNHFLASLYGVIIHLTHCMFILPMS